VVKATALDNAVMESFYRTLKVELIYQHKYQTRREAQRDIFEYIEIFYNRERYFLFRLL
jgi:transposase InsO family protein